MRASVLFLAVGFLFFVAPVLHAGAVFDFRAPNAAAEGSVENQTFSAPFGAGVLTVRTTGHLINGTPAQNANANAFRTVWGLGVQNLNDPTGDRSTFFNSIHVDGKDPEFIRLEFSQSVKLQTAVFMYAGAGSTDRFGLVVDGNKVDVPALFGTDVIKDLHPAGLAPGVVRFPDTVPGGTTFDFLAPNWGGASFDEWNLEKLEAVPEPASIFAFSFLGLAAVAWRHRSTRREPIAET